MKKLSLIAIVCMVFVITKTHAQSWTSVLSGIPDTSVDAMAEYDGKLYMGGYGSPVRCWNDTAFGSIGTLMPRMGFSNINAMIVYDGKLYIGGNFDGVNGIPAVDIAVYDGSSWSAVDAAFIDGGVESGIFSFAVCYGHLFVGGYFDSVRAGIVSNGIAEYDGVHWNALVGTTLPPHNFVSRTMCEHNAKLYVGGGYLGFGQELYQYDATGLSIVAEANGSLRALCSYDGRLYIGGDFDSISGVHANQFATWNDTVFAAFGSGITNDTSFGGALGLLNTMFVRDSQLYIGGEFQYLDSVLCNGIARYDGHAVHSVDTGVNPYMNQARAFAVHNGSLYAGGVFDTIGGSVLANNIAKLTETPVINSLSASPISICSGNATTLSWSTSGVYSAYLSGGVFSSTPVPVAGSLSTGPLYSTTTYTLYGYAGSSAVSQSVVVSVISCTTKVSEISARPEEGEVTIINMNGQVVNDTMYLPSGTYIKRVTAKNGVILSSTKFVVIGR